jgi:hypothetical protein
MAKTDKNRAVRRQKEAERRSAKRKEKVAQMRSLASKQKPLLFSPEMFPDEQLLFWLAHGVNYMVSDYDQGLWNPLFEGIYEGKFTEPPELAQAIMLRYQDQKEWPVEAKAAVAWTVSERHIVYIYYREVLRRLRSSHPDVEDLEALARQPHQAQVWEVFKFLKDKLLGKKVS